MWTTIKNSIPNSITSMNLLSGCIALACVFHHNFEWAAYFVFFAALFDFCDGLAARALKAYSPLGLQLDSLADMVSFGVVPAAILYEIMLANYGYNETEKFIVEHFGLYQTERISNVLTFIPFLIAIFSALRLAKFNIDVRQKESFLGLPTPACAILVASLALAALKYNFVAKIFFEPITIIIMSLVLSALLVCEIPMFSLKVKPQANRQSFIKKYLTQIIFLAISLIAIIVFGFAGVSLAILLYILISVTKFIFSKQNSTEKQETIKQ